MRVGQPSQTEYRAHVTDRNEEMNEIMDMARAALKASQYKNKGHYDLRRRPHKVTAGQLVWRKNHVISDAVAHFSQGLAPKNVSPFIGSRDLGSNVFELICKINRQVTGIVRICSHLVVPPVSILFWSLLLVISVTKQYSLLVAAFVKCQNASFTSVGLAWLCCV